MNQAPLLTILTLLPLLGGAAILCLGQDRSGRGRWVALVFNLVTLLYITLVWVFFEPRNPEYQFVERLRWIPSLGVEYILGADGLSILLLLLTGLLVPMATLASWHVVERSSLYFAMVLFLQAGLIGTFTALNFFHWFLFWELSLVPAFFLVRLWGGSRRAEAATRFFVYTMAGSVAMLLGFIALYLATGTFDFATLAKLGQQGALTASVGVEFPWAAGAHSEQMLMTAICLAILLGFAVKIPILPLHSWLPLTYTAAPIPVTMLLTGVMSKMGVYGLVRIVLPIFPEQLKTLVTPLLWLAIATIVFSAAVAFAQRDLRAVLAYSSINHLGYCVLGVFAVAAQAPATVPAIERVAALNGVALQMFNHGLTAATLFWMVAVLEQRTHGLRGMTDFGGLRAVTPVLAGFMGIALFSSLGLPGLNGFVSEFLIFKGAFPLVPWAAALATPGLMITAVFLLTLMQRVFHGPVNEKWKLMPDLSVKERILLGLPVGLMLFLGVWPQFLLGVVNSSMTRLVAQLGH